MILSIKVLKNTDAHLHHHHHLLNLCKRTNHPSALLLHSPDWLRLTNMTA